MGKRRPAGLTIVKTERNSLWSYGEAELVTNIVQWKKKLVPIAPVLTRAISMRGCACLNKFSISIATGLRRSSKTISAMRHVSVQWHYWCVVITAEKEVIWALQLVMPQTDFFQEGFARSCLASLVWWRPPCQSSSSIQSRSLQLWNNLVAAHRYDHNDKMHVHTYTCT